MKIRRLFERGSTLCGLLTALCSCAGHMEYLPPSMDVPASYSSMGKFSRAAEAGSPWWKDFGDPLLTDLVDTALQQNIGVSAARARVEEAQALALAVAPGINVNGDIAGAFNPGSSRNDTIEGGISALFDLAGGRARRAEAAIARSDASEADWQSARQLLISNVVSSYVDLRFSQTRVALAEQDLRLARRTLADVTNLKQTGQTTKLDELQAKSIVAETSALIPLLKADVIAQENRIATLLGVTAGRLQVSLDNSVPQPIPSIRVAAGVPADLIRNRPDIRGAEKLYRAAIADIGAAKADRYPSLSLSGTISANTETNDVSNGFGIGLNIPIFDQGARSARVDARTAAANAALLDWKSRVLNAIEEVETGLSNLNFSTKAVQHSRSLLMLNSESVQLSRDLLLLNEITTLEFLDLQRALGKARSGHADNVRLLALHFIALSIALS